MAKHRYIFSTPSSTSTRNKRFLLLGIISILTITGGIFYTQQQATPEHSEERPAPAQTEPTEEGFVQFPPNNPDKIECDRAGGVWNQIEEDVYSCSPPEPSSDSVDASADSD